MELNADTAPQNGIKCGYGTAKASGFANFETFTQNTSDCKENFFSFEHKLYREQI